jgi:hypothetical protein
MLEKIGVVIGLGTMFVGAVVLVVYSHSFGAIPTNPPNYTATIPTPTALPVQTIGIGLVIVGIVVLVGSLIALRYH